MPRKRAIQTPGDVPEPVEAIEAHPVEAPGANAASEYEAAQAKANKTGRAQLTSKGWVCPHPDSQPAGKR